MLKVHYKESSTSTAANPDYGYWIEIYATDEALRPATGTTTEVRVKITIEKTSKRYTEVEIMPE